MKNLKFLGMLFCLCLLSCGGKAQEAEKKEDGRITAAGRIWFPKGNGRKMRSRTESNL